MYANWFGIRSLRTKNCKLVMRTMKANAYFVLTLFVSITLLVSAQTTNRSHTQDYATQGAHIMQELAAGRIHLFKK